MRFPIAYYLMLLYLMVMFKPLIPLIIDGYAHIFSEPIHLSTIHAKFGSNHREKALANSTSDTDGCKSSKNSNGESQFQVHLESQQFVNTYSTPLVDKNYVNIKWLPLPDISLMKFIPPPRLVWKIAKVYRLS